MDGEDDLRWQTQTFHRHIETEAPIRQRIMGVIFLLLAFCIFFFFVRNVEAGEIASFGLTPGGVEPQLAPWEVPAISSLYILAIVSAILGGVQLSRGFKRWTNAVLGIVVAFFIFGFLIWATAGKSLNLAGLASTTLSKAVPLTLGAMSGVLCERAGVVNIAIEGMMLSAALVSALIASITDSLILGLLAGIITGALLAAVLAVLSIKYKTDQIISGTVINILSTGLTSYISAKFMQVYQELNNPGIFQPFEIPLLVKIPIIGPILFDNNIFVYAMYNLFDCIDRRIVQYEMGVAGAVSRGASKGCRYLGHRCLQNALHGRFIRRYDGRVCRFLFHVRFSGAV